MSALITTAPQKKSLTSIQVLRGVAALLVACYHAGTLFSKNVGHLAFGNAFRAGHTGVTIFFVLSGFIIYYIHHKDIGKPNKFRIFIAKRFVRIYPIYWVVILIKMLMKVATGWFLIQSILLIPFDGPRYLSVSWTLSFEVYFYLLFSLLIGVSSRALLWVFGIYVAAILGLDLYSGPDFDKLPFYIQFIFHPLILEFVLGVAAAHIVIKRLWFGRPWVWIGTGVAAFALFYVLTVLKVNEIGAATGASAYMRAEIIPTFFERYSLLFFAIPSMLIIIGCSYLDLKFDLKMPRLLTFLGDASYSIYLVHAIVLNAFTLWIAKHTGVFPDLNIAVIAAVILAVGVGSVFHIVVEKPLLKYLNKYLIKTPSK